MKTTFKFIIAAMAAISVFSSCQKELANETVNNTTGGVRTIAVQFDNSTKATLDNFTPKFANGDKIRVSNTEKSEERTISVDGSGNATFSTTLSGALTAIYPLAAAVYTSGTPDGPITSFKVPASQDGDIAKAIIAKATVEAGSSSATFNVQTALFQITPPDDVKTFTITSLKTVVSGARTGDAVAINTEGETDADKLVITVSNDNLSTFYVALVPGVNLTDLSFEYTIDATHGAMKGIPEKDITAAGKTDATAANTKYTIGNTYWHPYVEIQMNSKTYKWATMNIGATSATEAGYYFAWGYAEGCVRNTAGNGWVLASDNTAKSFSVMKFPNRSISTFKDAATVNWGGSWRMPTKDEFNALGEGEWVSSPGNGRKFGTSPNTIFLPAAGYGLNAKLNFFGENGFYWSSKTGSNTESYCLGFRSVDVFTNLYGRYFGQSVRPISE